ncbi:PH domain-containing protein [Cumulibacter manganitolerans]|uniref:PH domain-containing protein n=1 Tax=Cumulibacter manganitolerans TaxID=1884992 RepID=UPI0012978897|nr:PH domain-containing protein [Cumulibacter manganitolerans]
MGFPENILTKDEKVVRSLHPHWLTVLAPTVIGILIIAAAWLIVAMTPVNPTWDVVDWIIIGLGVLLLIIFVLVPFLRWRTTRYVITTNRVAVRRGVLSKSGQDIGLSKITDVSFHQSFLDRIIRSGSLHIETAGDGPDEDIANIPRSNQVQQLLNRLVEEDAARRGGFGAGGHRAYDATSGSGSYGGAAANDARGSDPAYDPRGEPRPDRTDRTDRAERRPDAGPDEWETPPLR